MILKNKSWGIVFIFIQLSCVLTPSNAIFEMFGGGGGGGGGSDVAEILAAGLITTMLMEDLGGHLGGGGGGSTQGRSVFNPIRQFIGGYSMRAPPPAHHYQPMIAPRRPMMHPAGPMVAPSTPRPVMHPYMLAMMHRHQQYMMHQALMQQARQQMLATAWRNEYRMNNQPFASETVINSYVPVLPTFGEILSDENTLSAAILLNSDLLDSDDEEEQEREEDEAGREEVALVREEEPKEQEKHSKNSKKATSDSTSSEEFEVSSSDHETHYILPRIMKHIVERILRRVEHH